MKMERDPVGQWLDTATKAIRFGPDRRTVRSELSAHLEDKALDFQRIFPGLTEDEARERAASDMGDPEKIARAGLSQLATTMGILIDKYTATVQNEQALRKLDEMLEKIGGVI